MSEERSISGNFGLSAVGLSILAYMVVAYAWAWMNPRTAAAPPAAPAASVTAAPTMSSADIQRVDELIGKAMDAGAVKRVDANAHEAQVNAEIWGVFDADQKKGLALSLAVYCGLHSSPQTGLNYVDVIDGQSGRKIAKVSPFGFEVF